MLHEMLPTPKTKCPRLATFYQKLTIPKGLPHLGFPFYKQLKVILSHIGPHTSLSNCLLIIHAHHLIYMHLSKCDCGNKALPHKLKKIKVHIIYCKVMHLLEVSMNNHFVAYAMEHVSTLHTHFDPRFFQAILGI
jgi:hypothetical protein